MAGHRPGAPLRCAHRGRAGPALRRGRPGPSGGEARCDARPPDSSHPAMDMPLDHDMIEADHEGPDARPRGGASTARGRGVGSGAPGGAMMDEATRALVAVSAAIGADERERRAQELERAARAAEPGEVEEALLQSYLFVGFPGALNALALWRERTGLEASGGAAGGDASEWRRRGEAVCARVYGAQYGRLRERVAGLHPDLEAWMLEEGYG